MRGEYPMLLLVKIPSINRKDILRIPFLYLKKKRPWDSLPDRISRLSFPNPLTSCKAVVTLSSAPNKLSSPRVRSMRKNKIDQKVAPGIWLMASVKAIKTNPGPLAVYWISKKFKVALAIRVVAPRISRFDFHWALQMAFTVWCSRKETLSLSKSWPSRKLYPFKKVHLPDTMFSKLRRSDSSIPKITEDWHRGAARIFQRGREGLHLLGYSPDCRADLRAVFYF